MEQNPHPRGPLEVDEEVAAVLHDLVTMKVSSKRMDEIAKAAMDGLREDVPKEEL